MANNKENTFLVYFSPSHWTQLKKFSIFIDEPYDNINVIKGIQTALSHYEKCKNLGTLANNLINGIDVEKKELNIRGFTSATYSKMVAALLETIVCELYSVLDGVKLTIYGVYKGAEKIQRSSVEKMFKRAYGNEYGEAFPKELNTLLSIAYKNWYLDLKTMRTEFTHGEVGSVHKSDDKINYFHNSLNGGKVIEDITSIINNHTKNVINLVDELCSYFYDRLNGKEKEVLCGFYNGRVYQRTVRPELKLSFDSGECKSKNWFEDNQKFKCPMVENCGAYK